MSQNSTSAGDGAVVAFLKRRWLAVVIVVVVVALILANNDSAEFDLIFVTVHTREWVVILVSFVLGGVAGWIGKSRRVSRKV